MDAQALSWIALVGGAFLAGAAFVGVLVVPARGEALTALTGLASFGVTAYSLFGISSSYGRADAVFYAFGFMLASAAGGWALASTLLSKLVGRPYPADRPEGLSAEDSGTAVIVVSGVEPSQYGSRATADVLERLAEEDLIEPTVTALPFMFFGQKARYRAIGGSSPSEGQLAAIAEQLEEPLSQAGVASVDWATCVGERRVARRVLEAVRSGYRRIVVTALAVGESLQLSTAMREVDALRLEELGVSVRYTGPLGAPDRIAGTVVDRILSSADDPSVTGAVLVGHGQPEERARRNPTFDEQEMGFLNRVRMLLVDRGIPENNVRIAWADWNNPDVTSAVRHLAALGCRRVVVCPAVFPTDSIAIRLDLEIAVRQARVEEGVIVVTLPAWRSDEQVVAELASRVERELER